MFRELKQLVSAFGYRFWSKSMPKLNRFRKKNNPDPLDAVNDEKSRARIILAVKSSRRLCVPLFSGFRLAS